MRTARQLCAALACVLGAVLPAAGQGDGGIEEVEIEYFALIEENGVARTDPYGFSISVEGDGSLLSVLVTPPAGGIAPFSIPMEGTGDFDYVDEGFASQVAVEALYPRGSYQLDIGRDVGGSTVVETVVLGFDPTLPTGRAAIVAPAPGARVPWNDVLLDWTCGACTGTTMVLQVIDTRKDPVFLDVAAVGDGQIALDPGTLRPGSLYVFSAAVFTAVESNPTTGGGAADVFRYLELARNDVRNDFATTLEPIPVAGRWWVLALAGLLLCAGALALRRRRAALAALAVCALLGLSGPARAQAGDGGVIDINIEYTRTLTQQGIPVADEYGFLIFVGTVGDVVSVDVTTPAGGVGTFSLPAKEEDFEFVDEGFAALAPVEALYPRGGYTFSIERTVGGSPVIETAVLGFDPATPVGEQEILFPFQGAVLPANGTRLEWACSGCVGDALSIGVLDDLGEEVFFELRPVGSGATPVPSGALKLDAAYTFDVRMGSLQEQQGTTGGGATDDFVYREIFVLLASNGFRTSPALVPTLPGGAPVVLAALLLGVSAGYAARRR